MFAKHKRVSKFAGSQSRVVTVFSLLVGLLAMGNMSAASAQEEDTESVALAIEVLQADTSFPPRVWLEFVVHGAVTLGPEAFEIVGLEAGSTPQVHAVSTAGMQVLLAIDTSGSMKGAAIAEAKTSALAFLDSMPSGVEIGLVSAGAGAEIVVPLTTDLGSVREGIEDLVAAGETAVYDAIATSIGLLGQPADNRERILIVMTDGGDTVSETDMATALALTSGASITLHGVSLETSESQIETLERFAAAANFGLVLPATDPAALSEVFERLTTAITGRYEVTFLVDENATEVSIGLLGSTRPPVAFPEAVWGSGPARDVAQGWPGDTGPVSPPRGAAQVATERIVVGAPEPLTVAASGGWAARLPFQLGAALLASAGLLLASVILWPTPGNKLPDQRRTEFATKLSNKPKSSRKFGRLANALERVSARRGKRSAIDRVLEQAGSSWRPGEYMVVVAAVSTVVALSGLVLMESVGGLLFGAFGPVIGRLQLLRKASRRRKEFAEQLGPSLQLLAGNLRVGHGLLAALAGVASESLSPSREEYQRVVAEVRLGRSLSESMHAMSERVESEDLSWVAQAVEIQREVGGDLAEVLDNVAVTLAERGHLKRHVEALAADGQMSSAVMMLLPFVVGGLISLKTPDYLAPLVVEPMGRVLSVVAVLLMVGGAFWLKKITKVAF